MLFYQTSYLVKHRPGCDNLRLGAKTGCQNESAQGHLKLCQQFLVGSVLPNTKQLRQKVLMVQLFGIDCSTFRIAQNG